MAKKYLYALLICLTIGLIAVPRVFSINENICNYDPIAYQGLELTRLSQELESNGLIGRIHGAATESQMFVLSVREPNNFFQSREFSLLADNSETADQFKQLNRHDSVCIQGSIIPNRSPQKHIAVDSIQVVEAWSQPKGFTPYERKTDFPEALKKQNSLMGKVHAIGAEGKILVVEYQDGVIPIYTPNTEYTRNLYRGDIIELSYQIQTRPQQPTHLRLDTTKEQPIKVLDAIAKWHNQENTLTGKLVKFPKSPQLKFDIYAMQVDTQGIKRYFTLVNFDNMAEFQAIRHKLAKIWDINATSAVSGRNMLINPEVTIKAQGITNIVSPKQANPQILLDNAKQVTQVNR